MTRKGRAITLSINDRQKAQLEQLALELGATWGEKANISKLVKDIADNKLRVAANHDWTADRLHALDQARRVLIDMGQIQSAIVLAHLLLERNELSLPLRNEIEQFIAAPVIPWRQEIDRLIRREQPFQLSYQDAADRIWNFTIRYAKVANREERQYLDCWCEETDGSQDLPELIHNRSLRLDRIPDAAITPISGSWRSGLDFIPVEFHVLNQLAFAYRTKKNLDMVNEWIPDRHQTRRIIRTISSTFWFFREVFPYGADCVIVSPDSVRDRFRKEVCKLYQAYEPDPAQ
ncbi:WYL domain-containing protein [Egbenema bharatensis]|uniref:WYL domain-containing protein n=1 Tax=Egbenema bharatensis TaxID=3463334 RepID=UPI003A83A4DE